MKAVILYDSAFGNTKAIAEAVASGLAQVNAKAVPVAQFQPGDLSAGDLLVVGSPINGWQPTPRITAAINTLGTEGLVGVLAAAFDTRVKLFIHGDAARKISHAVEKSGATVISRPMPFYVEGTEGPLLNGETERARAWGRVLLAQATTFPTS